jgi:hypothetical protein
MNRKRSGTILVSALLIVAAFTIAVNDVSAATSPSLGTAASFAVLAGFAITDVPTSTITGDTGLTANAGTFIGLTTPEVSGTIYAIDASGPAGAAGNNPGLMGTAYNDMVTAYGALGSQGCDVTYPGAFKDLVGESLVPGVYCATAFRLTGTLTLQGSGVWIFWSTSDLRTDFPSSTANVVGGDPCNVWWRVDSSATLGVNTQLTGNILALTSITLDTGATLNGRALAQTGTVALDHNTINGAICGVATTSTFTTTLTQTTIGDGGTVITTLTTITMYGTGTSTTTGTTGTAVPVGGQILPGHTSQPLGFVAILFAAAAIGLGLIYKRRTQ